MSNGNFKFVQINMKRLLYFKYLAVRINDFGLPQFNKQKTLFERYSWQASCRQFPNYGMYFRHFLISAFFLESGKQFKKKKKKQNAPQNQNGK